MMDVKRTKVESLDIIVTMMEDKPYYEIKYKEVGSDHFCIGYSSYRLDYVLEWKKQYFELVEREAGADQGWIPCSERSPEISIGDRCSEDVITVLKWYDGDITYSIGWYNKSGSWNEDCDNCKVIAWMPLPEPYKGE